MLPLVLGVALAAKFTLPRDAKIVVGSKRYYGTLPDVEKTNCERDWSASMTDRAIRRRFHTFHELREREMHDDYLWAGCGYEGTVTVGGRVFHWSYDLGNTLWTDYPDGAQHHLGGKYSDDPSEFQ